MILHDDILIVLATVGVNSGPSRLRHIGKKTMAIGTCVAFLFALLSPNLALFAPLGH